MALRQYLPEGCTYAPCDIHDRGEGCIVADLNKSEFPLGNFDYVTLLGVIEYIYSPEYALEKASRQCKVLLLDYSSIGVEYPPNRRNCGWINDYDPGQMVNLLISTHWRHISMRKIDNGRYLYICQSRFNTNP